MTNYDVEIKRTDEGEMIVRSYQVDGKLTHPTDDLGRLVVATAESLFRNLQARNPIDQKRFFMSISTTRD